MTAPTTTEMIAAAMVQIAAEDLGGVIAAAHRGDAARAHEKINDAIRQLDAARRMLA